MSSDLRSGEWRIVASSLPLLLSLQLCAGRADGAVPSPLLLGEVVPGINRSDRLVVKFAESARVRLRGGHLVSLDASTNLRGLDSLLSRHPEITVARRFGRSEAELDASREEGERAARTRLPDLNSYYLLRVRAASDSVAVARRVLKELRCQPLVETAFAEPVAQPALFDSPDGGPVQGGARTPDFTNLQHYLGPSPSGINARSTWLYTGGRGAGVKVIDIEYAWLWSHEDLPAPFFTGGVVAADSLFRFHGTAILGEMVARDNGYGVTGIASDMQAGSISELDVGVAGAIDLAASKLAAGDVILIELQAPGPRWTPEWGPYQVLPMEFWPDIFDAIRTAVANGRIVVEAGANGGISLDDPYYQGLFDRNVRDSGAILVGAGWPDDGRPEWFTNYGSRMDLNGWGSDIVTCGFGGLQNGPEARRYTSTFAGTSGASAMVAGAVADLQGMSKASLGPALDGFLARQILVQTGTPPAFPGLVGNRPNLRAARTLLLQGFGTISGTVRDASTGEIVRGADIRVLENGAFARSDTTGAYRIPLLSGAYTIEASDFFHQPLDLPASVSNGNNTNLEFDLARKPAGSLTGRITSPSGGPLAGARIRILGTPIPPAWSDAAGDYRLSGIPAGDGNGIEVGLVRGFASAFRTVDISAGQPSREDFSLTTAQTFENSDGGFKADSVWSWGTPQGGEPPGAFSGSKLWATGLEGPYPDNAVANLVSPAYDFSGAHTVFLSFTHRYVTENEHDGGNVQVWTGSSWVIVTPVEGYPGSAATGHEGYQPAYTGVSDGWQPAVFDLSAYAGGTLQFRFHFISDDVASARGWEIDDVAVYADAGLAAAPLMPGAPPMPPAAPAGPELLSMSPNPFHESISLDLRFPQPARVSLSILDPSGRRIRSLFEGPVEKGERRFSWDGRDEAGRPVPSGIYLALLARDGTRVETWRLARIR